MIFSKANLSVGSVASRKDLDRALNCIRLNSDGSTVAANGKVIMAVGPVPAGKIYFPDVGAEQTAPPPQGIGVPLELLDKVMKNLPKENPNVALTKPKDERKMQLTITDNRGTEQHIAGSPKLEPFPLWQGILKKVKGEGGTRVVLNRQTLLDALQALGEACPDKGGENAVYIEINPESTGMLLRCVNRESGQRAVAGVTAYKQTDGRWLPSDSWEQSVFDIKVAVKKKIILST